jgi:steroid 5-alpha reductase family enzyme
VTAIPAFFIGLAAMSMVFALSWIWARRIDNYSLVDAVWAFGIGLTAVLWLSLGQGDFLKRGVAATIVIFWSLRLGSHLTKRISRAHPEEDSRYQKLRDHWKDNESLGFFGFFQMQGLSAVLLALPFLMVSQDGSEWGLCEWVGVAIALIGIGGESLADHQMSVFKSNNKDSKLVCREGLWRYSRHPNYFFELVSWLGFYGFACGSEYGWMTFHAPLIMLFLLVKVTGIPPTEASAVSRKGDAYRDYQRTTSAFIPLPPRISEKS